MSTKASNQPDGLLYPTTTWKLETSWSSSDLASDLAINNLLNHEYHSFSLPTCLSGWNAGRRRRRSRSWSSLSRCRSWVRYPTLCRNWFLRFSRVAQFIQQLVEISQIFSRCSVHPTACRIFSYFLTLLFQIHFGIGASLSASDERLGSVGESKTRSGGGWPLFFSIHSGRERSSGRIARSLSRARVIPVQESSLRP